MNVRDVMRYSVAERVERRESEEGEIRFSLEFSVVESSM